MGDRLIVVFPHARQSINFQWAGQVAIKLENKVMLSDTWTLVHFLNTHCQLWLIWNPLPQCLGKPRYAAVSELCRIRSPPVFTTKSPLVQEKTGRTKGPATAVFTGTFCNNRLFLGVHPHLICSLRWAQFTSPTCPSQLFTLSQFLTQNQNCPFYASCLLSLVQCPVPPWLETT